MKKKRSADKVSKGFVTSDGATTPHRLPLATRGQSGSLLLEETRALLLNCQKLVRHGQRLYGRYVGEEQPLDKPHYSGEENEFAPAKEHPWLKRLKGIDDTVLPSPTDPEARREMENQLRLQHQLRLQKQNKLNAAFNPKPGMGR